MNDEGLREVTGFIIHTISENAGFWIGTFVCHHSEGRARAKNDAVKMYPRDHPDCLVVIDDTPLLPSRACTTQYRLGLELAPLRAGARPDEDRAWRIVRLYNAIAPAVLDRNRVVRILATHSPFDKKQLDKELDKRNSTLASVSALTLIRSPQLREAAVRLFDRAWAPHAHFELAGMVDRAVLRRMSASDLRDLERLRFGDPYALCWGAALHPEWERLPPVNPSTIDAAEASGPVMVDVFKKPKAPPKKTKTKTKQKKKKKGVMADEASEDEEDEDEDNDDGWAEAAWSGNTPRPRDSEWQTHAELYKKWVRYGVTAFAQDPALLKGPAWLPLPRLSTTSSNNNNNKSGGGGGGKEVKEYMTPRSVGAVAARLVAYLRAQERERQLVAIKTMGLTYFKDAMTRVRMVLDQVPGARAGVLCPSPDHARVFAHWTQLPCVWVAPSGAHAWLHAAELPINAAVAEGTESPDTWFSSAGDLPSITPLPQGQRWDVLVIDALHAWDLPQLCAALARAGPTAMLILMGDPYQCPAPAPACEQLATDLIGTTYAVPPSVSMRGVSTEVAQPHAIDKAGVSIDVLKTLNETTSRTLRGGFLASPFVPDAELPLLDPELAPAEIEKHPNAFVLHSGRSPGFLPPEAAASPWNRYVGGCRILLRDTGEMGTVARLFRRADSGTQTMELPPHAEGYDTLKQNLVAELRSPTRDHGLCCGPWLGRAPTLPCTLIVFERHEVVRVDTLSINQMSRPYLTAVYAGPGSSNAPQSTSNNRTTAEVNMDAQQLYTSVARTWQRFAFVGTAQQLSAVRTTRPRGRHSTLRYWMQATDDELDVAMLPAPMAKDSQKSHRGSKYGLDEAEESDAVKSGSGDEEPENGDDIKSVSEGSENNDDDDDDEDSNADGFIVKSGEEEGVGGDSDDDDDSDDDRYSGTLPEDKAVMDQKKQMLAELAAEGLDSEMVEASGISYIELHEQMLDDRREQQQEKANAAAAKTIDKKRKLSLNNDDNDDDNGDDKSSSNSMRQDRKRLKKRSEVLQTVNTDSNTNNSNSNSGGGGDSDDDIDF